MMCKHCPHCQRVGARRAALGTFAERRARILAAAKAEPAASDYAIARAARVSRDMVRKVLGAKARGGR